MPTTPSQPHAPSQSPPASDTVCTGCGLLCDDYAAGHQPTDTRCLVAGQWLNSATAATTTVFGRQTSLEEALTKSASQLLASQRTLVTGLATAPLEAIGVASQLAEKLAAAIDGGLAEMARTTGPTIARVGEVTAAFEELRDRADLVIFWNCDPSATHPRFLERFIEPPISSGRRQTISLGGTSVLPSSAHHRHFQLTDEQMVPTARLLQHAFEKRPAQNRATQPELLISEVVAAMQQANCIGFVSATETDHLGLSSWALAQLVRRLAHHKPAFQIPLGGGIAAGGPNAAGLATRCTWRYGSPGAIATADCDGSRFEPAEADARRLIDRGEVDCLLVLGPLPAAVKEGIATAQNPPAVIALTDLAPEPVRSQMIVLAVASARATAGTMLREDGRLVRIIPRGSSALPTLEAMLTMLNERIQQQSGAGEER